ncbi:MAG: response regulator transcription factor [Actinomycetota bacterium]|nr:response regulator transcription factor [Actinomycetota bacterium]
MAPTLLIVDDHDQFRAMARLMLAAEGFDVVGEAADGESAINAVRELQPDVVLLDVVLPDIDGFTVCTRLANESRSAVVVLTSSRDVSAYRRRLRESAARGFIPKSELSGERLAGLVG